MPELSFLSAARDANGRALLTLTLSGDEEHPVITVRGDIDLSTVGLLTSCGRGALADGAKSLTLDLSEVAFFSVAGLHSLLTLRRDADHQGAQVVLRDPSSSVQRVVELSGLGDALGLEPEPSCGPSSR